MMSGLVASALAVAASTLAATPRPRAPPPPPSASTASSSSHCPPTLRYVRSQSRTPQNTPPLIPTATAAIAAPR